MLQGKLYQQIALLLDGTRTSADIVDALSGNALPFEAQYALERLRQRGVTTDSEATGAEAGRVFWGGLGIEPTIAASALHTTSVNVRAIGLDAAPLIGELTALGIRVVETGGTMTLVATDDYTRDELSDINREAHDASASWMLVKPVGVLLWIGPVFVPGQTPCWECLRPRLVENRQAQRYATDRSESDEAVITSVAALAPTVSIAAALAATELARHRAQTAAAEAPAHVAPPRSSRGHAGLAGRILTFDVLSHETAWHSIIKRPHCAVCGTPSARQPRPIDLQSRPKRDTSGGGHRVLTPHEAYERLKHLVSPITGIVNWMKAKEDQASDAIHTYSIGHPFPILANEVAVLRANLRYRAGGKGLTDTHARVSAICEAIERYSCIWRDGEAVRRTTARALGDRAIPLNEILQFSERQFATRLEWNRHCTVPFFHLVPHPFDEETEMDWSAATSLTTGDVRYVPSALCYYNHPDLKDQFFCWSDSNGTASGATQEEAILQGAFELIERDAVGLWWYNRARRAGVDIDSFALPEWPNIRREYARRQREIWALDLTTDLGIPTFVAVSRRVVPGAPEEIIVGFGAHFDATVALTRAITEANELLPAVSRRDPAGRTIYLSDDKEAIAWWKECTIASEPYVTPHPDLPPRTRAEYASLATPDLRDDVQTLARLLQDRGFEMFVLDQTHPDIELPVVRVIVPGLRHFWRRLGPGRLYDVPVAMGWLPRALDEQEMNPRSVFL